MKDLYVLFDADCELCVRCRNWLAQQPAFVPLVFIALQSDEAQRRFPGLDALKPDKQLLVISDEGAVYRGANAWIMCLWALENYRQHAQRLGHPILLPLAKSVCELLSRNRFFLSDALFRQEAHSAARKLAAHYALHKLRGRMPVADDENSFINTAASAGVSARSSAESV
jgi:predicted DCC family thiol-disulfide oxidoreductase YuxK